ncbi:MAG: ParB/RepB/Spo0J family partition protein [Pseudomonadota bacterium]
MVKLKGLGRGLDALLASGGETVAGESLQTLGIALLQPGKYQPRTYMDEVALAELAESIKAQGVMQPILVRPVNGGRYEIIAGERRWRAARLAGLNEVPTVVREVPDEAALAMALIENIQREDLNPLEEAHGIQRLVNEFGMTHQAAAEAVGRSRSAVSNLLRLLSLAKPVQDMLGKGELEMGHARALLALSTGKQLEVAHTVIHKGLSVRETERLVNHLLAAPAQKARRKLDRDLLALQEEIAQKLGTQVAIKTGKKGAGKLVIDYANLDQLDGILQKLDIRHG